MSRTWTGYKIDAPLSRDIPQSVQFTHQDMPDVLVGPLEGTEANANAQQPLAAPTVAWRYLHFSY